MYAILKHYSSDCFDLVKIPEDFVVDSATNLFTGRADAYHCVNGKYKWVRFFYAYDSGYYLLTKGSVFDLFSAPSVPSSMYKVVSLSV